MESETPATATEPESPESEDAFFGKFVTDIQDGLEAGEKRLDIPPGTLSDLYSEPDYIMVIKIIAAIEPTVNDLIAAGMAKGGGLGGVPNKIMFAPVIDFAVDRLLLSGRAGKLELAKRLDMLGDDDIAFAETIAAIRNRYAHNIKNASRNLIDLILEAEKNNAQLSKKLFYGMRIKLQNLPNGFAKVLLAWSFSRFLESAERRLHVPTGGFLNGLLGLVPAEQRDGDLASGASDGPNGDRAEAGDRHERHRHFVGPRDRDSQ
ncbi:hypothetical protein GR205_25045 [Rhizobium leguminosarum]|uniref:hypothetical protein n=1 Tax=Rhizobium ruizarguesonis TaxID=2081791 RepID=UPI0013DFD19E|nr:hypothetical protein [Rhizobium ruizarguesonis]NEJ31244.1 hypothetical protein [Rhizobium ruizarguesonis]